MSEEHKEREGYIKTFAELVRALPDGEVLDEIRLVNRVQPRSNFPDPGERLIRWKMEWEATTIRLCAAGGAVRTEYVGYCSESGEHRFEVVGSSYEWPWSRRGSQP